MSNLTSQKIIIDDDDGDDVIIKNTVMPSNLISKVNGSDADTDNKSEETFKSNTCSLLGRLNISLSFCVIFKTGFLDIESGHFVDLVLGERINWLNIFINNSRSNDEKTFESNIWIKCE